LCCYMGKFLFCFHGSRRIQAACDMTFQVRLTISMASVTKLRFWSDCVKKKWFLKHYSRNIKVTTFLLKYLFFMKNCIKEGNVIRDWSPIK
jgi:hypothetical protein